MPSSTQKRKRKVPAPRAVAAVEDDVVEARARDAQRRRPGSARRTRRRTGCGGAEAPRSRSAGSRRRRDDAWLDARALRARGDRRHRSWRQVVRCRTRNTCSGPARRLDRDRSPGPRGSGRRRRARPAARVPRVGARPREGGGAGDREARHRDAAPDRDATDPALAPEDDRSPRARPLSCRSRAAARALPGRRARTRP